MIKIDGSMGEGGGQILRMSVALSAVLGLPVKIYNIRKKRSPSGLRPQHLNAVKALAMLSDADIQGLHIGSEEIEFIPRELKGGNFKIDIGTAGSISLMLQALLPAAVFSRKQVNLEIRGGSDVPWSPPIDYMRMVFLPTIKKMGANIEIELIRRGHYPKGGGIVRAIINPVKKLESIRITEPGKVIKIKGISHAVRLPSHVAERQANSAIEILRKNGFNNIEIIREYYERNKDPHIGPGSGITLWAITEKSILGGDALGARGKPAEKVGEEAARKLLNEINSGAAFDRHMGDMLVIWSYLANGLSEYTTSELTLHAKTCLDLIKIFNPNAEIRVEGDIGKPSRITIRGISFEGY